nr:type IX secretion system outer membrane channel protein PorV [Saprospiraceae bacterium]
MFNKYFYTLVIAILFFGKSEAQLTFDEDKNCVISGADGACASNTVTSAFPFMRIIPDARAAGMGDTGIAISPDMNSVFHNASNLAFVEGNMSFAATYTPWLANLNLNDIYLADLTGFKKIDKLQTIGFELRYFNLGQVPFLDENGIDLGEGRPREFSIGLAYARKLGSNFSAALGAKYINSNLAGGIQVMGQLVSAASSFAADVSFTYRNKTKIGGYNGSWAVGMNLSNLGSKISYIESPVKEFIPTNLGLGTSLKIEFDDFNTMEFALDFNKLLVPTPIAPKIVYTDADGQRVVDPNPEYDTNGNGIADFREKALFSGVFGSFTDAQGGFSEEIKEIAYSFGMEYWYDKQFAVRAGYYHESA